MWQMSTGPLFKEDHEMHTENITAKYSKNSKYMIHRCMPRFKQYRKWTCELFVSFHVEQKGFNPINLLSNILVLLKMIHEVCPPVARCLNTF